MIITELDNSYEVDASLLNELLKDKTTGNNIIWATENYSFKGYRRIDQISVEALTGKKRQLIRPRNEKSKKEQIMRSKDKGEVFTPSRICNKQNNLIDNAWFGDKSPFNSELENGWVSSLEKIDFSKYNKKWQDYVKDIRLEITCGEAPYLTSRYDTVSGEYIEIQNRVGILDRKLRVVSENVNNIDEWIKWAKEAYKSIYAFEYQGDNLFIARKNLLFSFVDYYKFKFNELPSDELIMEIVEIITWNIFQMDGLKFVVPESCKNIYYETTNLFGEKEIIGDKCLGCKNNNPYMHNGKYCYVMDWEKGKKIKFVNLVKG